MSDPFIIQTQDNSIKANRIDNYFNKTMEGDYLFGNLGAANWLRTVINQKKILLFAFFIIFCFSAFFFRIIYLQIYRGDYYRGIAEGNRIRIKPIRANRGIISDRNGTILARNVPSFSFYIVPADLVRDKTEIDDSLRIIADVLGISWLELENLVKAAPRYSYNPILVAEEIPYELAMLLKIKSSELGGVYLETVAKREYLEPEAGLAHILGYGGRLTMDEYNDLKNDDYLFDDYLGKTGVEKTYEKVLRGKYGKKKIEVDFLGKEDKIISIIEAEAGKNLVLTVDLGLQKAAQMALEKYAKDYKAKSGVAIVMDVNSGEILTLYSWPAYDNNLFASGISGADYQNLLEGEAKPLFNRAIAGEYPPGSTFKLIEAAGALEDKIIDEETHVFSTGGIRVGEWFFPDWKAGGHGRITVAKAIADSVNTFFYYIGGGYQEFNGLGLDRINYWAYTFGLGQKSGIDLSGEADGFLPTREWKLKTKGERWYIGDTYHLAIGQGDILVTPLQVARYTAAIANGGKLYQPHVALGYLDQDVLYKFESNITRENLVSSENFAIVRGGMRDAVVYGSSLGLAGLPVAVAGKTGTAQAGTDKEPHAWFTGFAPYEKPEIAVTVLVENGGEGSRVAVPVAREILQYYFAKKKTDNK